MTLKSDWLRIGLALGLHMSCVMLPVSVYHVINGLIEFGNFPIRFTIIIPVCLATLAAVICYSDEPGIKTFCRILIHISFLVSLGVILFGLGIVFTHFLSGKSDFSVFTGFASIMAGMMSYSMLMKGYKSKWLN
ncbi:hypothetical protein [Paraglaciecola sp. 2405UD69-4]|uniref:hypothetical protein n=1 Tax=Paraglaciecola sp. 2405UD69-4 TaxID=3391836 RepID=UPI0039C97620